MTDSSSQPKSRKAIIAALIALISASAGGAAFLHKHPQPTLREVFASCEKGELSGIACCEDMSHADFSKPFDQENCGMVSAGHPDPLGFRAQEEDQWDKDLKEAKP